MFEDYQAAARSMQAAWDALEAAERDEIIDHYDDLNAQGRLGDAAFYDQWIALHRKPADRGGG